jgi:D-methionine transport system substrate-binding protein
MIPRSIVLILCLSLLFHSCSKEKKGLKVAATPVPHAEMLQWIQPDLKTQGIDLEIVVIDDYNLPNRALADGDVDANFFQHLPFLEAQKKSFGFPLILIASIQIEPMGIYSKKVRNFNDLKKGSRIALPSDPSNEARALLLLQKNGWIKLKREGEWDLSILDIASNPHELTFIEMDAALLPHILEDVDAAIINANFALGAGLIPSQDALLLEDRDSPFANILVVQEGSESRDDIQALKKAMTSEKMRQFIQERYRGSLEPAF